MRADMTVERVNPLSLDETTTQRCADITNASHRALGIRQVLSTGTSIGALWRHSHDDRPVEALWLARRRAGGEVVGYASLEVSHWDNPDLAFVVCSVDPEMRGQGIGTTLLHTQYAAAAELGKTSLLTFSVPGTPGAALLLADAWQTAQETVQRRFRPQQLDPEHLQTLYDEAAQQATEYELVRLHGPAPAEWLPTLQQVHEAINDAPLDDVDLAPDHYPVERILAYEAAMAARRQHMYRLMARHRDTGDWAGHTIVCMDGLRPGIAFQEDTSVIQGHRGHRLGLLLKVDMLRWLRDEEPDLETIDTWNAVSNTHMIAVNERIGCTVNMHGVTLQTRRPTAPPT